MIEVSGPHRPALYKRNGKLYAVAGGKPMEVPAGTLLKDLCNDSKQQNLSLRTPQLWKIIGSTGNKYIVKRDTLGSYSCTCLGFNFRKCCSHIKRIEQKGR